MDQHYRLIFYDFETTGLDINKEQPIEIGAIDDSGRRFHRLIKLERPDGTAIELPKIITDLTGHTSDKLVGGARITDAFDDFLKWIFLTTDHRTIFMIAHNGDKFDHLIFKKWTEGKISRNDSFRINFLDTYVLARLKYPTERSYKLIDLSRNIAGYSPPSSHNALADCLATIRLYEKLL